MVLRSGSRPGRAGVRREVPERLAARLLGGQDLDATLRVLARDPAGTVFVASRVARAGLHPMRLGGEVWGHPGAGPLRSVCYSGANLVPHAADEVALRAFSDRAMRQGRRCSSIMGHADQAMRLWEHLEPVWGPARDVRESQPLLATAAVPDLAPARDLRPLALAEMDLAFPAAVAMFTEEVGVSPLGADGGTVYRGRVGELLAEGRMLGIVREGRVVFKADVAAVAPQACQVQGVWVDPALRGSGLGTAAVAAVVAHTLRAWAPLVTLYVNDYNQVARRVYERCGFSRIGTYATVLF